MQVIGNDDPVIVIAKRPGLGSLEVDLPHLAAWPGKRQERRSVTIDRAHNKAAVTQEANMPAAAGGEVKHKATWFDQRQKAVDPSRRRHRRVREWIDLLHWGRTIANNAQSRVHRAARRWCR